MSMANTRKAISQARLWSAAWFIALSALPSAFAGQQSLPPASGDFVLEIAEPDRQIMREPVPSTGSSWMESFEFKRLANWRRPPNQDLDIGAIHMDYRRQGDAVRIDVKVIFGKVDLTICEPVDPARVKSAGTYVLRLGESASLQGLAQFGIDPIKVKVVAYESHTLTPAEIGNKTKAIEVVQAVQAGEDWLVVLKNISSKNIVGLQVNYVAGSMQTRRLIAPGEVYKDMMHINESYLRPPTGKAQGEPLPPKVVVSSVLFEDSTFEGDLWPALTFMTEWRGTRIQILRIISLLQAAIENPEPDSGRALETLRQQISALSNVADMQMIDDLAGRYGPFTTYQRNGLISALRNSLSDTQHTMLERMRSYETREAPKGTSLQSWLKTMKSQYEERIKKL